MLSQVQVPGRRRFQVVNLGRRFLGQDEALTQNRLLGVRTNVLLSRGQLIFPPEMQKSLAAAKHLQFGSQLTGPVDISAWTEEERNILNQVSVSASPEELADLARVDTYFGGMACKGAGCQKGTPLYGELTLLQVMCVGKDWRTLENYIRYYANNSGYFTGTPPWQGQEYNEYQERLKAAISNPFYCSPWIGAEVIPGWLPSQSKAGTIFGISSEFKLDVAKQWGQIRLPLLNSITFMKVMKDYPFPIPINMMPQFWFRFGKVLGEVQNLVHQPVSIPPELIKFWATMSLVMNYNEVSQMIKDELKRRAEKQFWIDLLANIIIGISVSIAMAGVASAIAPLLPAGLNASAVLNSIKTGIDQILAEEERQQAAREMQKVAKQFQETDAAFAKEVEAAARFLDYAAAEQERTKPLDAEEQAAAQQRQEAAQAAPATGGALYDVPPPTGPDLLPVAGGVAAVGILAVLLATLK